METNFCESLSIMRKIKDKEATIGVIGLGYVGVPLLLRYCQVCYKVVGFDINIQRIDLLNSGKSDIAHIPDNKIAQARKLGFEATADFSQTNNCDALILCVPTPLNLHREPDLSFIINTMNSIFPYLRKGQIISLESTTYPGTTEEELLPRIEKSGLKVGRDIFLVYSPEREDPGNSKFNTVTIPKVVGGHTSTCLEAGIALYSHAINEVIPVSSTGAAELTKLLENIHRAVNIGLVNEMKIVADKMGIDIFEVIDAASSKPFGFTPYYPGPGLGGHCIPIDPFYLTWKAREYGVHTRFIELSGEINSAMPKYVVSKLVSALNGAGKALSVSSVLVLGLAYKKNIDDIRESPSLEILSLLKEQGANIAYSDPFVLKVPKLRRYSFDMNSVEITKESLEGFDAVILLTDHDAFDYPLIGKHSKILIDTRGKYREKYMKNLTKA
ncbi:MAG: UDP-N-acetyl-D-glucosamine dehydrogenase [Zetaproteobacteria bacterium]|nr:UDP-N-acetyl-D-glucosamine dehydrogenase [Pseudobdellovibrionaceae bacterium]